MIMAHMIPRCRRCGKRVWPFRPHCVTPVLWVEYWDNQKEETVVEKLQRKQYYHQVCFEVACHTWWPMTQHHLESNGFTHIPPGWPIPTGGFFHVTAGKKPKR